jgi:hypothetical protein
MTRAFGPKPWPNCLTASALIPMGKLTDYCLNPDHARGKDKARVFVAVLGITQDSAHVLADLVR